MGNAHSTDLIHGVGHHGAVAIVVISFEAKEGAVRDGRHRGEIGDRLILRMEILQESLGVPLPVAVSAITAADRLWATKIGKMNVFQATDVEHVRQRFFREAGFSRKGQFSDIDHGLDGVLTQQRQKAVDADSFIADCVDDHISLPPETDSL